MKNYSKFAMELAEHAGSIMLKYFNTGLKKEWKADNTPVTQADININKMVIESILKEYPSHGILEKRKVLCRKATIFGYVIRLTEHGRFPKESRHLHFL